MTTEDRINTPNAAVLPARYYVRAARAPRGWNVRPTPLMEPALLRHWYTRAEHAAIALGFRAAVIAARHTAHLRVNAAERAHGARGPLIAGGLRQDWPVETKDAIRASWRAVSDYLDAARAHWRAAGRRRDPFGDRILASEATVNARFDGRRVNARRGGAR